MPHLFHWEWACQKLGSSATQTLEDCFWVVGFVEASDGNLGSNPSNTRDDLKRRPAISTHVDEDGLNTVLGNEALYFAHSRVLVHLDDELQF
jgi:hypothetical protein